MNDHLLEKIIHYCNYQPRCHKEVRNKLFELGCHSSDFDEYIASLIQSGHLNEERYAKAFARGKFRMKQWGKLKIDRELKADYISAYCIKKAMTEIGDEEYLDTLLRLTDKKLKELNSEKRSYIVKNKIYKYLFNKGFEPNLIQFAINEKIK